MAADRIVPNRYADDARAGRDFFTGVLGLDVAMEQDFITTYCAPGDASVQISVVARDPSGLRPDYSIGVDDVEAAHDRAVAHGHEIVYPLRDEPWGVRRFFARDPLGGIANIVEHQNQ